MKTIWINEKQLAPALERNEAFWRGELEDYPLIWVTAPGARPVPPLPEPADKSAVFLDPEYAVALAENRLARTYFAGDALPFFDPWLGPDQFAAWLGADLSFRPDDFTSWSRPFVEDWAPYSEFRISPDNRWWRLYLDMLRLSVDAGRDKWVTAFPDLHTGIDALAAIRGPEKLLADLLTNPVPIKHAMKQMTQLWKFVVDTVAGIVLPAGQGTTNWTAGWSEKRFLCIGQNDVTCMMSPQMFDDFCLDDTSECAAYADYSLYHLDGPGALQHLPRLLEIDHLHTIQWVHGDGHHPHSKWLDLLERIQQAGKAVQIWYNLHHTTNLVNIFDEIELLSTRLDPGKLFIGVDMKTAESANAILEHTRHAWAKKHRNRRSH